jgi:hypothetical protein
LPLFRRDIPFSRNGQTLTFEPSITESKTYRASRKKGALTPRCSGELSRGNQRDPAIPSSLF